MEKIKVICKDCFKVETNSWSKNQIISFLTFKENNLLGGVDFLFLPEIVSTLNETVTNYARVFWSFEQTSELNISTKLKMAPITTLDWNEMFTTVFTMLQFHLQHPEIKILDENKPNYFLSAGNQRIFSLEIFYLELKYKDNKWAIDCNKAFYDRLHETNWYPIGSKLFFAIEPVT